jgi:hypothetical protein
VGAVVATGLFALVGVIVGGILTTRGQIYRENKRNERLALRARTMVAAQLFEAQYMMELAGKPDRFWSAFGEKESYFPNAAWREYRGVMVETWMNPCLWSWFVSTSR